MKVLKEVQTQEHFIVFNAIAIKTGGGLQKTASLLSVLSNIPALYNSCCWIVVDGTPLAKACDNYGFNTIKINNGMFARLKAEILIPFSLHPNTVLFNLGGACMLTAIHNKKNISECAYSNLFYPEINFWKYETLASRCAKFFIDLFRIVMIGFSDEIVFQTDEIRNRALKANLLPKERLHVINPAVSSVMNPKAIDRNYSDSLYKIFSGRFTFLFACGDQRNKRIQNLPFIASKIKSLDSKVEFLFVITLSDHSPLTAEMISNSKKLGCEDSFCFIGQHSESKYASLLNTVDAVCNFAVLESFSNNFIEAWSFGKPLITTSSSWASAAAGSAAYYVQPDDIDDCATRLIDFYCNPELRKDLVIKGELALAKYPTPKQKAEKYLSLLLGVSERRSFKDKLLTIKNWLYYLWIRTEKK